jgi:hypothetical protein
MFSALVFSLGNLTVLRAFGVRVSVIFASLSCSSVKWVKGVSLKFPWQGRQFTCVSGPSRPVYEIPVLLEFCNFTKPLRAAPVRNGDHVGKVTRSQATADRQLNPLQQPSSTPLPFEPVNRNWRSTVFDVPTATSLANR